MSSNLESSANQDLTGEKLAILHNNADDGGGGVSSKNGGLFVLGRRIHDALAGTQMRIRDVGVVNFDDMEETGNDPKMNKLRQIVRSTAEAADHVEQALSRGERVLSLGGNHVRGLDVIGALRWCHEQGIELGLVWVDAHPDANTPETSLTGDIHGMVSAVLLGHGPEELLALMKGAPFLKPENVIYVGLNAIDNPKGREKTELTFLQELVKQGTQCFTMRDMKASSGPDLIPEKASGAIANLGERLKAKGGKAWVELDADVFRQEEVPAAVMDNPNGMPAEQGYDLFEQIGHHLPVIGMGVSELSPGKETPNGRSGKVIARCVAGAMGISNIPYSLQMDGNSERPNTFDPQYDPSRETVTLGMRHFYPEPGCEYEMDGSGGMYNIFIKKDGRVIGVKAKHEHIPDLRIGSRVFLPKCNCYGTIQKIVMPYTDGRTDDVLDIELDSGQVKTMVKIPEVFDERRKAA